MIKQLSISETRKKITSLETDLSYEDTITITNHGKEIFALLRWDTYESITETLEILSDESALADLKIALQQVKNNEFVDFEDFKKSVHV